METGARDRREIITYFGDGVVRGAVLEPLSEFWPGLTQIEAEVVIRRKVQEQLQRKL
jgi:hypothetical protein